MMARELLLATNNSHKRLEFVRLFPGWTILTPRDVGVAFDFEENGETFLANALGKAMELHGKARRPVMADDSGLCVDALGGAPGIHSSRYGAGPGGALLDAPRRNAYLLDRMRGITDRGAFFVCCLVLVLDGTRYLAAQETVHGAITEEPRGAQGFGYDPLFLLPARGRTIAELPDAEKDAVSHRGRAARRVLAALEAAEKDGSWI
jgi:XTP/dITP diphosphohydrolase